MRPSFASVFGPDHPTLPPSFRPARPLTPLLTQRHVLTRRRIAPSQEQMLRPDLAQPTEVQRRATRELADDVKQLKTDMREVQGGFAL